MANTQPHKPLTAIPSRTAGRLLPVPRFSTIITVVIILLLIYAFFSRITLQFYASILFLFYSMTKSMWVSVVLLGVFQTLLMIPFRITNLLKSANIKEFKERFKELKQSHEQQFVLRKSVSGGRRVALYYLVNFFVYLTSYISIGRLFLINFYATPLDPKLLYNFVPYPDYPLLDRFFKIPYVWFENTVDLGMRWVFVVWVVGIILQVVIYIARSVGRSMASKIPTDSPGGQLVGVVRKYATGYLIVFLILSYIVMRNFPVGWEVRIFSGDVAEPNRQFNTITAIVTFATLVWINLPKIKKKTELALEAGMDEVLVRQTEKEMFRETLRVSALVGLGAYFITNQIPSAFELSIFTLEMISLLSPLTLDPLILASVGQKQSDHVSGSSLTPPLPSASTAHEHAKQEEEIIKPAAHVKVEAVEPEPTLHETERAVTRDRNESEDSETERHLQEDGQPANTQKVTTDPLTGKKKVEGEIQF